MRKPGFLGTGGARFSAGGPRRARSRGAAAVEFALIMPMFVGILCGMIDWSNYFYQRYALSVAIRDGIRAGVGVLSVPTPDNPDDAWTTAQKRAYAVLSVTKTIDPSKITWGPTVHYGSGPPTKTVTLSASLPYVPLIGFTMLGTKTMSYSMTMMLELDN